MESLLTKLYSRCTVGDSEHEAVTNTSSSGSKLGKEETVAQATCSGHQPKPVVPRAIQCDERTSPPCSGALTFKSQDDATITDHDSSDSASLRVPAFQQPSSREDLTHRTAAGVLNSPPHNAVTLRDQGTRSELESGDTTASKDLFIDHKSGSASGEPVVGQSMGQGDVLMSRQEMESFELLDVSDFESDDSSESHPPNGPLQPSPQPSSTKPSTETAAATRNSCLQFNQSKFLFIRFHPWRGGGEGGAEC